MAVNSFGRPCFWPQRLRRWSQSSGAVFARSVHQGIRARQKQHKISRTYRKTIAATSQPQTSELPAQSPANNSPTSLRPVLFPFRVISDSTPNMKSVESQVFGVEYFKMCPDLQPVFTADYFKLFLPN